MTCGIESFARGQDRQGGDVVMLNVNCLEGVPPVDRTTITHWDGRQPLRASAQGCVTVLTHGAQSALTSCGSAP